MSSEFTQSDWKKWEKLQKQCLNIKLEVWLNTNIESYVLQYQDRLAPEFHELFPRAVIGESAAEKEKKNKKKALTNHCIELIKEYNRFISEGLSADSSLEDYLSTFIFLNPVVQKWLPSSIYD